MDNDKSSASSPSRYIPPNYLLLIFFASEFLQLHFITCIYFRNPFSDSDLVCAGLDSDEQFVGIDDKLIKNYWYFNFLV